MGAINSKTRYKNKKLFVHKNCVSERRSSSESFEQCNELKTFGNRKYLNGDNVRYIFPIDHDELKRLELTHTWNKALWNEQSFALPACEVFNRNAKILDIGLDMAQKHPNCHFTGFDVYFPPDIDIKGENVKFTLGNILNGLPYEDNSFDLVFMRSMKGCFTNKDYNSCLQEMIRVSCRWILIIDSDIVLIDGGPLATQLRDQVLDELLTKFDISMMPSSIIRKCLESSDKLSDISFDDEQCPIGKWGGEIGMIYWQILKWSTKNIYHSVSSLGYSEEEYNLMIDEAFDELNQYHAYNMGFRICAKKKMLEKRLSSKYLLF
ncbi:16002_t:CDS:2 [Funneliformis mosseae]|uniref:16002_t:CDS:1 n=1 Tax=Funneliformis mosseae TaxID=27381 RepID=A0A9N8VF43_FUNMO|nr:16002_t:CDS:2 [Funneliformis mosseae]